MLNVLFMTCLLELAFVTGVLTYWFIKARRQETPTEREELKKELRSRLAAASSFVSERRCSPAVQPEATLDPEVA